MSEKKLASLPEQPIDKLAEFYATLVKRKKNKLFSSTKQTQKILKIFR